MKLSTLIMFLISINIAFSQISIEKYQEFLKETQNYDYLQLKNKFSDDLYKDKIGVQAKAVYFDSINNLYKLTYDEKFLLKKHGFVVTERLSNTNYWDGYLDIYNKDLPVFISTDVIMHTLHRSYDNILIAMELKYLIPKIETVLSELKTQIPVYADKYKNDLIVINALKDLDVYLTIAKNLLLETWTDLYFPEMKNNYDKISSDIYDQSIGTLPIFSPRDYDYSQLKPRGHYTQDSKLMRYFKSMMWLGRTEIYLTKPQPEELNPVTDEEIQKQVIAAVILAEMFDNTGMNKELDKMDKLLKSYIGESDNVQNSHIKELRTELNIKELSELDDFHKIKAFQELLLTKTYADQKILSQIIWEFPMGENIIKPASAYLLLGQRFIMDSYILANVVHDKVFLRMLPNSLDMLFTLGNNSALQFLKNEIIKYDYAPNLAALRYLTDANSSDFWNSSLYNTWLNSIRMLNPPNAETRKDFPEFMQTAAYWQEKMNSQLCSWTELRHDNLLYAKQSYSGSLSCSYPYSYVEPFPQLYKNISNFMKDFEQNINEIFMEFDKNEYLEKYINSYFSNFITSCDNLSVISEKELKNQTLSAEETTFLKKMLYESVDENSCAKEIIPDGWLTKMFFAPDDQRAIKNPNYVVADVHTAPTDEYGNMVGWVKHVGTGDLNAIFVNVPYMNGQTITFTGHVQSFNEYTSTNFLRLTDEEWLKNYYQLSSRPEFTELYLADTNGYIKTQNALSLMTGINDDKPVINKSINSEVYPNPGSNYTYIKISIPENIISAKFKFEIFDLNGILQMQLSSNTIQSGDYLIKWDGTDLNGKSVKSGTYYYKAAIGNETINGNIVIVK
jgi:hypothetical protein